MTAATLRRFLAALALLLILPVVSAQTGLPQSDPEPPGGPTPNATVTVTQAVPLINGAELVSQMVPSRMESGQAYTVSVTMKNTGTTTWRASEDYKLGSQNPENNMNWGVGRVSPTVDVAPGQQYTFQFDVRAPAAGTYNMQWRMLRELVEWFGGTTSAPVTIIEPSSHLPTIQVTRNPQQLVVGQPFTVSWNTTNANSVSRICTAGGTGFNVNELLPISGSRTSSASKDWVGHPSTCTWTATGPEGTANFVETMSVEQQQEVVTYIHTDGLGSPVARTNANGGLVTRTRYEPYGSVARGEASMLGFSGHVNDTETGLVYMQQRYYDPDAGRFLSIDPVTTDANTGSSFNRYAYAANSPYKYIDPDGRVAITAEICLGFCAGITIGYNVASTEIAIVGNVGAGMGGGIGLDLRPNENGRAGSSSESRGSGVSGNTYSKGGVEVKTPVGSVGLAGKVVAGKDLGTGKTFGGLSPEIGVSKERGAKVSVVAAGGVEGAGYVNVRDAANDIKTAISTAASDFNKNVVQPALKAMEPQIDNQTN